MRLLMIIAIVSVLFASSMPAGADDRQVTLRAGFASVDITPEEPMSLMGYGYRWQKLSEGFSGVRDPLYARVTVFDDGGEQLAAIVSTDLCVIPTHLATSLREAIAERIETDPDRVILATTHTHSGPVVRSGPPRGDGEQSDRQSYAETLREKLCSAAAKAAGLTFPVEPWVREAPLGLAYDRRVVTDEGVEQCWGPQEWPDRVPDVAHDTTLTVLMLRQTNGPRKTILWSFGAHPVVLGKTSRLISADFAGVACTMIDERLDGARSMFLLGASGDSHPWIATQEDPDAVDMVAEAAASFVVVLAQALRPAGSELRIAAETVRIGRSELPLAVWRLGDVYIVAAPVELFGELGVMLRQRLDGPVLLATLANGWEGYWPTERAFEEGGYEISGARSPGDGEKLVEELVRLAETLD